MDMSFEHLPKYDCCELQEILLPHGRPVASDISICFFYRLWKTKQIGRTNVGIVFQILCENLTVRSNQTRTSWYSIRIRSDAPFHNCKLVTRKKWFSTSRHTTAGTDRILHFPGSLSDLKLRVPKQSQHAGCL